MKSIYARVVSVVIVSSLAVTSAFAGTAASMGPQGASFEKDGAQFSFSREGGIKVKVGDASITYIRVGDDNAGKFVVISGNEVAVVPYTYKNDALQIDEHAAENVFAAFQSKLQPADIAKLQNLGEFVTSYGQLGRSTPVRGNGGHSAHVMLGCDDYQLAAIGAFTSCPVTFGLGCLGGAYILYREWTSC